MFVFHIVLSLYMLNPRHKNLSGYSGKCMFGRVEKLKKLYPSASVGGESPRPFFCFKK